MEKEVREIYKDNFAEYLLCLALDIGEDMLKSGGEISRVENTVERICQAYGAAHTEVFTIVSVMHASVRMPDGSYSSQMRRVKSTGINFNSLERLNSLSRYVCGNTPPLEEFEQQYKSIKHASAYPKYIIMLAYGLAAGSFALFFGGNLRDALTALIAGVIIFFIDSIPSKRINGIAKVFLSSLSVALLAAASCFIGLGESGAMIITGTIMLLVPGVTIGTATRDIFYGDMLSGMLKFLQACLTALMIAFGYFLAVSIVGGSLI